MSFTLKLDLSKLLKLTDSQSWTPSAVQAIISELNRKIPTELMNASNYETQKHSLQPIQRKEQRKSRKATQPQQ